MNARNHKEYTIAGFDSMPATLVTPRQPTPLLLAPVGDHTVALDFEGGRLSSDAGLILLKDVDDQLGLTRALAAVLADARDARRIHFTLNQATQHWHTGSTRKRAISGCP